MLMQKTKKAKGFGISHMLCCFSSDSVASMAAKGLNLKVKGLATVFWMSLHFDWRCVSWSICYASSSLLFGFLCCMPSCSKTSASHRQGQRVPHPAALFLHDQQRGAHSSHCPLRLHCGGGHPDCQPGLCGSHRHDVFSDLLRLCQLCLCPAVLAEDPPLETQVGSTVGGMSPGKCPGPTVKPAWGRSYFGGIWVTFPVTREVSWPNCVKASPAWGHRLNFVF